MPSLVGEAFPSGFIFNGLVYSCVFCVGDMPTYIIKSDGKEKRDQGL